MLKSLAEGENKRKKANKSIYLLYFAIFTLAWQMCWLWKKKYAANSNKTTQCFVLLFVGRFIFLSHFVLLWCLIARETSKSFPFLVVPFSWQPCLPFGHCFAQRLSHFTEKSYSWKKKQIKNKKKGMKNWEEPEKRGLKKNKKSAQNLLGVSSEVSGRGTQCGEQPHTSINRAK